MTLYPFVLACHIMSITTWMLMLIYLPKLFVYYATAEEASQRILGVQINSLWKMGTVAMIFSIKFGVIMLYLNAHLLQSGGWIHAKLTLVLAMVAYHFMCKKVMASLLASSTTFSLRFLKYFRVFPEIVTTTIIFLTVLKPF